MSTRGGLRPGREAGAVLPIALFGILVISLLVASALLTASSELVLSRAYQEGLRSLHEADAALESFAANAAFVAYQGQGRVTREAAQSAGGEGFAILVTALREGEVSADSLGTLTRRDLFSIVAEPEDGRGRIVGALIETVRRTTSFRSGIDAAVTAGGDASIGANATLAAFPQSASSCPTVESPLALRVASAGVVAGAGAAALPGGVQTDTADAAVLVERALNSSLADLALGAEHYFGASFGEPPIGSFDVPRHDAASPAYRWGCPDSLVFGCPEEAASDVPVVVIDGAGSEIELDGGHGQGVLIITGGGAKLGGDFRFAGLVLVEGRLTLEGNAQVLGAAVAGGDLVLGSSSATASDGPAIVFHPCSIAAAEHALSLARLERASQTLDSPTFGWYEVVR